MMADRKLEQLTPEQESLMKEVADDWIQGVLGGDDFDEEAIKEGIRWIYIDVLKKEMPSTVVFLDSPLSCVLAKEYMNALSSKVKEIESSGASVRAYVGDFVGDSVWASVRDSVRASVRDSVRDFVGNSVWASVRDSVRASVGAFVRDSVWASVGDFVGDSVWASVGAPIPGFYALDALGDASWVSFYDYFTKIGVLNNERFNKLREYLRSGAAMVLYYENAVFVSHAPIFVSKDDRGRLHHSSEMAVSFGDGWGVYAVHGVRFTEEEFNTYVRNEPRGKDIVSLRNTDQRTALIQHWGYDKVFNDLPGKQVIDRFVTTQAGSDLETEYVLFEYDHTDSFRQRVVRVEWWEHGHKKTASLGVPPSCSSCREAVAWTYGYDNPADYWDNLLVRT